jgi:endonuclease-3
LIRQISLRENRRDRTDRHARCAINALVGIDDHAVLRLVKTIHGTDFDAIGELATDTGFSNYMGHDEFSFFNVPRAILGAMTAAKSKVSFIMAALRHAYPDYRCALEHGDPLQLLVATILSAQCTDVRVNLVTPALFAKYQTAADFAAAPRGELESFIRSTGFFRNKARSIRHCCRTLVEQYGGRVPDTLAELVLLDGIGRKTANCVLGNAYGKAEGIVVDTHVMRLSRRMGLTRQSTPEKIELSLMKIVPRRDWIDFSHLLIWHGRRRCMARKPDCVHCEIRQRCPKIGVKLSPVVSR